MTRRSQAAPTSPPVRAAALGAALGLALVLAVGARAPAGAQEADAVTAEKYEACMRLVARAPDRAFERALTMQDMGGGRPAKHCAAAALSALGHHAEAAKRFEALATGMPDATPPEAVAEILAHAGLSWLSAGKAERALSVQNEAVSLAPESPALRTDRAMTLGELGRYWEAIDDLNRALESAPGHVDALVLRASAYRFVEAYDLALENAERALEADPGNPDALLERGMIHRLRDRPSAARADWIRIIKQHPDTAAAEMARRNLDKLDFGAGTDAGGETSSGG